MTEGTWPEWRSVYCFTKKQGPPALYFICHRRFSVLQQCPIVSMKFSGSLKRRILYYYVPAKFRSLFSFCCSQRAHNLLSAARPATKLHCCSANRPVSVDGSARCEVCLSAAAAGGSLGTPTLRRAVKMKKRNDGRRKEIRKKRKRKTKKQPFLSPSDSPFQTRKRLVWGSLASWAV